MVQSSLPEMQRKLANIAYTFLIFCGFQDLIAKIRKTTNLQTAVFMNKILLSWSDQKTTLLKKRKEYRGNLY